MKKRFIIILILLAMLFGMIFLAIKLEKKKEVNKKISIEGYDISVKSLNKESDKYANSYFTTYFEKKNYDKELNKTARKTFYVSYDGIEKKDKISNFAFDKTVKINGKTFYYIIEGNSWNVALYYEISADEYLVIKVHGGRVIYSDGEECKCLATVDENILKSKEMSNSLIFKIKK